MYICSKMCKKLVSEKYGWHMSYIDSSKAHFCWMLCLLHLICTRQKYVSEICHRNDAHQSFLVIDLILFKVFTSSAAEMQIGSKIKWLLILSPIIYPDHFYYYYCE